MVFDEMHGGAAQYSAQGDPAEGGLQVSAGRRAPRKVVVIGRKPTSRSATFTARPRASWARPERAEDPQGCWGPGALRHWPLLYDLGWDADWSYCFARQGARALDLSRASGFRLYSMLVQAAESGLGAAIGRPMLIAKELESRTLVTGGSLTGTSTVLESSGEPFAEGSNHLITCVAYGKTTEAGVDIEGACTITDASGDSWFALAKRRAGVIEAGGGGEGRWKLVGGTGKFDGIEGGCSYDSNYLPGVHAVSIGNCTWQRP